MMELQVNGHTTYCYTGGKAFEAAKPTVVFIHGVLHDHSVWILQTRYLANHGWNVLASNTKVNLFHTGFKACDSYSNGEIAMAKVQCPVLFVLGRVDQMTPPAAAQNLVKLARDGRVVVLPVGHHEMTEAPEAMLAALTGFLKP